MISGSAALKRRPAEDAAAEEFVFEFPNGWSRGSCLCNFVTAAGVGGANVPVKDFASQIYAAVRNGRLKEPFRSDDVRHACAGWASGTYSAFLAKHAVGNPSKTTELFKRVAPGQYRTLPNLHHAILDTGGNSPARRTAMQLLITDVSEMHQGDYSVAGWCAAESRMVRLLPHGSNWTAALLAQYEIASGSMVDIGQHAAQGEGAYPHRTEDTRIVPASIRPIGAVAVDWTGEEAPPTSETLNGAFHGHVRTTGEGANATKAAHVLKGTQIGSLAAIRIPRGGLSFFENDYRGSKYLKAYLDDAEARYNLPVVAKNLREISRAQGANCLNETLPENCVLHVRLGLARAWPEPAAKCMVVINGVHW